MLSEEGTSYSDPVVYIRKCKEVRVLPMSKRFELTDLVFFHRIIYSLIPVNLPNYLSLFSGTRRTRSTHYDSLSIISSIHPSVSNKSTRTSNQFANSFFYRTHLSWNRLPLAIREIECPLMFKSKLKVHLWQTLIESIGDSGSSHSDTDSELDD